MLTFTQIWLAQLLAVFATSAAGFSLSMQAFHETRSVSVFGTLAFLSSCAGALASPLAGVIGERWPIRGVMIGSVLLNLAALAVLVLLYARGGFHVGHAYLFTIATALVGAAAAPALFRSISVLVPAARQGRAAGMLELANGLAAIAAPSLAAAVLVGSGLRAVLALALALTAAGLVLSLLARVPAPKAPRIASAGTREPFVAGLLHGWRFVSSSAGLPRLLAYVSVVSGSAAAAEVLLTPLVLRSGSPVDAGRVLTIAGLGLLAGSVVVTVAGAPRRFVLTMALVSCAQGVCLVLASLSSGLGMLSVVAFAFMAGLPVVSSSSQALWLARTAPESQARVYAFRRTVMWAVTAVAPLGVAALADAGLDRWLGEGRSIAVLLGVLGLANIMGGALASRSRQLRLLEGSGTP
jgi:DHA3 family macrolide efflux protein-like MFS transporter